MKPPELQDSRGSLERAFGALELLAQEAPRGVTDLARALRLEKSSVSRLMKTLCALGYASQGGRRGRFRLGPRVLYLGARYLEDDRLVREARPVLEALAREAKASAHLAAPVGGQFILLSKVASPERIQVASAVGAVASPHASALGKVLLAFLPPEERSAYLSLPLHRYTESTLTRLDKLNQELDRIQRQGYALEEEEEHAGVGCIGAPVRDVSGRCVAALSLSGPLHGTPFRLDTARIKRLTTRAETFSRTLGYLGGSN